MDWAGDLAQRQRIAAERAEIEADREPRRVAVSKQLIQREAGRRSAADIELGEARNGQSRPRAGASSAVAVASATVPDAAARRASFPDATFSTRAHRQVKGYLEWHETPF